MKIMTLPYIEDLHASLKREIKSSYLFQKLKYGLIRNVLGREHDKRALLVYLTKPFKIRGKTPHHHANLRQTQVIGKIISDIGFRLDVVNHLYKGSIAIDNYDLIFGFGFPFERSFLSSFEGTRVYYATGPHSWQMNSSEPLRIKNLYKRRGVQLRPRRIKPYPDDASAILSNAIFCVGNEWTAGTYRKFFDGSIFQIPVSTYTFFPREKLKRNWEIARQSFLWIGTNGLVSKGLDLCLDAFAQCPDIQLNICGRMEDDFYKAYKRELTEYSNIHFHGFTDIASHKFKEIVENCAFVIYPCSSEGTSGSVLTAMGTGLIPIVTQESGVNIEEFGFRIKNATVSEIIEISRVASRGNVDEIRKRSSLSHRKVKNEYNIDKFSSSLKDALVQVIDSSKQ